ncbi:aspartate aminotransferase family protein [Mechercharimyces sp. CAU 1602]|uniref:pyridoxal phosphate-dependent decarboxylase family protein n=1 Tax=Mechercharimyces sp. CAU 1602 TaxID=2973933 RepID=UPI002161A10E|nr:aspartate aminotransferase family protein [Mechercharimyces sp. CAU 1602]MCS1352738.1 aspartate aminotransferase family protein [Mechercharimyces sp. CAU 1602]
MDEKVEVNVDSLFLNETTASRTAYERAMKKAHELIQDQYANLSDPYSGREVGQLRADWKQEEVCTDSGRILETVLQEAGEKVLAHSIAVHHPRCAAHLHCPPLIGTLAAEAMISATNQSMDSWDQSPAATLLEENVVRWLTELFDFGEGADGVFTSGGTQSNFMGLLLARDRYINQAWNWNAQQQGLPPEANQLRILCSEAAHFTVKQSAALLGLGEQAVVTVATDHEQRLSMIDFERQLEKLKNEGKSPFAVVATAGTTDFGSIDPLSSLSKYCRREGMWLHVDAAYGGALILSDRHRFKLAGVEQADSVTVDFHKLFYQPISCGAFLLKEGVEFRWLSRHADYLNPIEQEEQGVPNLVGKSIQTTRRFDALKLWVSMQTLGKAGFASLLERTILLAEQTMEMIASDDCLQSVGKKPEINAVVFRYVPDKDYMRIDELNLMIKQTLLARGEVVLAQTRVAGQVYLKLTLLNPRMTTEDAADILERVKRVGREAEINWGEREKACLHP